MRKNFLSAKQARDIINNIKSDNNIVFAKSIVIDGVGEIPSYVIKCKDNKFIIQEIKCISDKEIIYDTYNIKNLTLIRHMLMYSIGGRLMTLENNTLKNE